MKCDELLEEIVPYYTNELDKKKMEEYKRHTMICKSCARYAYRIRKAIEFVKDNKQPIKKINILG
jgi:anti-sigma factor RsiW